MLQTLVEAEGEFVSTLAGKLASLQHGNATFPIPISSNNESIWKKKKYGKMLPGHGLLKTSIVQPEFSMGLGEGVRLREQSVFFAALPMSCLITEFRLECYCLDLVDLAYTPLLSWCKHLSYSVHKFRLSRCVVPMCRPCNIYLQPVHCKRMLYFFLDMGDGISIRSHSMKRHLHVSMASLLLG